MSKRHRSRATSAPKQQTTPHEPPSAPRHARQRVYGHRRAARRRRLAKMLSVVAAAIAVLAVIFYVSNGGSRGGGGGAYAFEVADPKPGAAAPSLRLPATDGSTYDLSEHQGKTVLLYFQEGLGCQPCWDQLRDIEADFSAFEAIGIDEIVTITSNPLDLLRQKGEDEGLTTPLLSDVDLSVSASYGGNRYGMMGTSTNGHSFILVDGDGVIRWRADYGGPPKYTMYVPVDQLITQIQKDRG